MSLTPAEQTAIYKQVQGLVAAAVPKLKGDGTPQTDPSYYQLGILPDAINQAINKGKTPEQIASAIAGMVRSVGWVRATGEFSGTDLLNALGIQGPHGAGKLGKPKMTPAEIKYESSNGANVYEATMRHSFFGIDGVNHRIEDADYDAARTALLAAYPAVPDAPKPPDAPPTGGTPGQGQGPGIG